MAVDENPNLSTSTLLNRIDTLEKRLIKVESLLRLEWVGEKDKTIEPVRNEDDYSVDGTESKIAEYGLAWIGSIVFFLGITFLMAYIASIGYQVMSVSVAYLTTFLLLGLSYYLKDSFSILTNVLTTFCILLLYYITLSLHFFTASPIVSQPGIVVLGLLVVTGIQFYHALRKNSELQASLAVLLAIGSAIVADSNTLTSGILLIISLAVVVLFYSTSWWRLVLFTVLIVYLTNILWLLGNPLMGHKIGIIEAEQYSISFLFSYALTFIATIFISRSKVPSNAILAAVTIWNALGFSLLMLTISLRFYPDSYNLIFSGIALFCIGFSVYLKIKATREFAPAAYATFGFMAMSIGIYGFVGLPNAYFVFALQSFLVVSMALWFRSQIIVVVNVFLFVFIILAYLVSSESIDLINFVLALTSLGTARILNWQKERLSLKTEIYRNVYLITASLLLLFAFNKALPDQFVTLSWTLMAILFFVLSIWLKNIKYRYLSIFTIIVTAGHLFFIDLANMEIGYRVIAFIGFAIISFGLSLYYTKRIRRN